MIGAVLEAAITDMQALRDDRRPSYTVDQLRATVWLAQKHATRWFDGINVDQEWALRGMNWIRYAEAWLDYEPLRKKDVRMSESQRLVLVTGIDTLEVA